MFSNKSIRVQEDFIEPSESLPVEECRRNKTLDYVWDRRLDQLSEAEVLEIAPYKKHIKEVLAANPKLETIALNYLGALSTNGSSQTLADLQDFIAFVYMRDILRRDLPLAAVDTPVVMFAGLDNLLIASGIVKVGNVPLYRLVVDPDTAEPKIIDVKATVPGRRFTEPQYNYALKMIFDEIPESDIIP